MAHGKNERTHFIRQSLVLHYNYDSPVSANTHACTLFTPQSVKANEQLHIQFFNNVIYDQTQQQTRKILKRR